MIKYRERKPYRKARTMKWENGFFYIRYEDGTEEQLGPTETMKGALTRQQKLFIITRMPEWVKVL